MAGGAAGGMGGAGAGMQGLFSDPGMQAQMAQKLALQANPDIVASALDQMGQGIPQGMQAPGPGMSDILGTNPFGMQQRQPGVVDPTRQTNLANSALTMPMPPSPEMAPPRPNLDPRSAQLLSQMAAGRGETRPPFIGGAGVPQGRGVNVDYTSLILGAAGQRAQPRAPALAHMLGLVR